MSTELTNFDAADYLDSPEGIAAYIQDAISDTDPAALQDALGTVARARGMKQIADATGLGRESLYKALSGKGDPRMSTMVKVCDALGLKLKVEAA